MRSQHYKTRLAVFLAGGLLAAPAAFANAILFDFGPAGSPSLTALFEDAGPNQVQLTVTAVALSGNNSVNSLYFNFNPAFDSRDLTITQIGSIGGVHGVASTANDSYKAIGGGGKFDIALTFGPSPTFVTGDVATFTITSSSSFSLEDFLFHETAAAGRNPAYAAGSLQELSGMVIVHGTPTTTQSVPDVASTFGLFVLGLSPVVWLSRRRLAFVRA